jgi:ABC-type uncharacterized transport system permease subunit
MYNTFELLMMGIVVPETWASNKICNKNHLLHPFGILFPHINDDAQSKSHQKYCQSCILLVLYIIQTYDAWKLKHKSEYYYFASSHILHTSFQF